MRRERRRHASFVELRRAREGAGLSQRQLALRMGVSWVTVNNAEKGEDVRHSTLLAYRRVLPALDPDELLGPSLARGSAERAWSFYRELFGFEAAEVTKTVRIATSGDSEVVLETKGLKSLRGDMRDLSILTGLQRAVFQGSGAVLHSIEATSADFTTRVVERREGSTVHQFRFPRRIVKAGISYRRRLVTKGLYLLTAARAARRQLGPPPYAEGTTLPVTYPIQVLRILVAFPARYWPEEVRPVVWPTVQVPDADLPDLTSRLHPEGLPLGRDAGENAVTLEVERPIVGAKYGVGWTLP